MFESITLEMSLKPFKQTNDEYIEKVCRTVFEQWKPLVCDAKVVSILLWTADGSEILDYKARLEDEFEWCKFVGTANPPESLEWDPQGISLHAKGRLYIENPPVMTYGILKNIISTIKRAGKEILGEEKLIRVGETFDIGPEFAKSSFKYERHNEICKGFAMGSKCFIDSNGILKGDNYPYAGYPKGVPDGTPFGAFLGRQSNVFLKDMGFDYLWLSNGVGFSAEPWNSKGAVFDGKEFHINKLDEIRKQVLDFWNLFRAECPNYPVETRGTNFSVGIDYATDAVPLYDIYKANLNILPPPNSPWAALDGNFGLELMGHMSRIAEIPDNKYLFRYYIHDPWWINSPWYDRYEGQPHDIYLPMAVARIDENGKTQKPTNLNILSIDNSWGNLPKACVNEPVPHIQKAYKDAPDAPAPLTWVYPFREYTSADDEVTLREMFSNDWFICGAINNTFPLSAVVTTDNFIKTDKSIYSESILVSPVPISGSEYERVILHYAQNGGRVLFYGGVDRAGESFKKLINVKITDGIRGAVKVQALEFADFYEDGKYPDEINLKEFISAGKLNTVNADDKSDVKAVCNAGGRVLATFGGNFAWYRAPLGSEYKEGNSHLVPDDANKFMYGEVILRSVLARFGFEIKLKKPSADIQSPVVMINRSDNAYMFSAYTPSTTVELNLKMPQGAPLLMGYETVLKDGYASYRLPRAEHRECRIFVKQEESSVVSCKEITPVEYETRRRLEVTGLKNATVCFYPETYAIGNCQITLNAPGVYYISDEFEMEWKGNYCEIRNVTGMLTFAMYRYDK